jgi:uncharacterized membrane protein YfcA
VLFLIVIEFVLFLLLGSVAAGILGSIVGLGGGVIIIPILTIFFGVNIHFAIGASIISVIATSSGAAATYVKDKMTNLRIGMFLELATTTGAVLGAAVAVYLDSTILEIVFGSVLLVSLIPLVRKIGEEIPPKQKLSGISKTLSLTGEYTERNGTTIQYNATNAKTGLSGMFAAGLVSGLLGIGSGTFKVISMDVAMKLPMKVSTTTSNFMIGVTAAASAGIYYVRGDIDPAIAAPVALGILLGSIIGTRLLLRIGNTMIRKIFAIALALSAVEMILRAAGIS